MAGPPPAPLPDPSSSDPLLQSSTISTSSIPIPSSDLILPASDLTSFSVLAPDPAAAGTTVGQCSSDHLPLLQPSRRRTSSSTRSSGLAAVSSRSSSLAAVRAPDLTAAGSSAVSAVPPAPHPATFPDPSAIPTSSAYPFPPPIFYSAAAPSPPPDPFPPLPSRASQSIYPNPLLAPPPPSSSVPSHPQLTSPSTPQLRSFAPAAAPSGPVPRSFAQVSRSSKGTGFVRSHADEVESFARLPRTGANIICGHREGIPSFSFVSSDLPSVEGLYSNALVMKFHGGRPSLEVSHKEIQSWGLEQPFTIGPLTSRSFLLRFQDHKDLIRVLSRPSTILISYSYKIFKWHNLCHLTEDSCLAPVWISLPRLPLQCFIPEFLETVANKIGRFLCFDKATSTLARPSAARLCLEIDLRKSLPAFIWVGLFEGFKQPIIYERLPKFCNLCQAQGHDAIGCPVGRRETLPTHSEPRIMHNRERTQGVRRNAAKTPSTQKLNVFPPAAVPTPPAPSHAPSAPGNATIIAIPSPQAAPHPPDDEVMPLGIASPHQQPRPSSPAPLQSHQSDVAQPAVPSFAQAAVPPPPLQSSATTSSTTTPAPIVDHFQFQPTSQRAPTAAATSITPPPQSPLIPPSTAAPSPSDALLQVQTSAALLQQDPAAAATSEAPSAGSEHQQTNNETNKELRKSNNPKRKSIAFVPQHTNFEAYPEFWEAVYRQLALNEQARLKANIVDVGTGPISNSTSEDPCLSLQPVNPQPTSANDDSNSDSSFEPDSQPSSAFAIFQDAQNPFDALQTYDSEGEEPQSEAINLAGYATDDIISKVPRSSKRNKRHPDQPLKVQPRVRKTPLRYRD